jgi:diapolycopene oxygenase
MDRRVCIVGGGLGGLAASIVLARNGYEVTLLEQHGETGGKMREISVGGFRFDTGPSLFTLPTVVDEVLTLGGSSMTNHFEVVRLTTICRYFFADSRPSIDSSSDAETFARSLSSYEPEAYSRLLSYLSLVEKMYLLSSEQYLMRPFRFRDALLSRKGLELGAVLLKQGMKKSLAELHSSFFESDEVRTLFNRLATYCGSDPYRTPALFSMIAHVEYGIGAYYPRGGMIQIARALTRVACSCGVTVITDAKVRKIIPSSKKLSDIETDSSTYTCGTILSNVDPITTYQWLPQSSSIQRRVIALKKKERSLSGVALLWGVRGSYPDLVHHNIFFPKDYGAEFRDIFQKRTLPVEPTIYLNVSSKTDSLDAPKGCENWFLLVNAPAITTLNTESLKSYILQRLAKDNIVVASQDIVFEKEMPPCYFESETGAWSGALYGEASHSLLSPLTRPSQRCPVYSSLFFAGGAVQPGGGIPLAIRSGVHAAEEICSL